MFALGCGITGVAALRRPIGGAPAPGPTPAPAFTTQPSISDDGTPQVGEPLTGNDGTITNGSVSARQWLRNGTFISGAYGASYVPTQAGDHAYRVTATGPGGSTTATSAARTVAAAPAPTPTPTPTPTLQRNATVLNIGDSTSAGVGGGSGGDKNINGARPFSMPTKAADRLEALGIPTRRETVNTDNNNGTTNAEWGGYRPEIAVTGDPLGNSAQGPTMGGRLFTLGAGQTVSFTTAETVDSFEWFVSRGSSSGTMGVSIDGGAVQPFSQNNATADVAKQSITGLAPGTHTITFSRVSGSVRGPLAWRGYRSTGPNAVTFWNAGARNWTTQDWVGATYPHSPLNMIARIAPDVVTIDLGINNYRQSGYSIAGFKANMQALIDASVAAGAQVILAVPNPIQSYVGSTDAWSQAAVLTAYQDLQAANPATCRLINSPVVFFEAGLSGATNPATFASMNALGHFYDDLHPNKPPYAAKGAAVGDAIVSTLTAMGIIA